MNTKKRECIEYALHAYDTFWDYYKKTLDERNQLLNNYMIFVGIPVSIIGLFIEKSKNDIHIFSYIFVIFLLMIFILGVVIYNSYIIESCVSERYLKRIVCITNYLIQNYNQYCINVFEEAYNLNGLFLNKINSKWQRVNKSSILIIMNTGILIGIFLLLFNDIKWYLIILLSIFSILLHIIIFIFHNRDDK